jgi:hypothetical protein
LIAVLVVVVLVIAGLLIALNVAASASVNLQATVIVYQPATSISHDGGTTFAPTTTGTLARSGDSIKTDTKGRASIQLPDGSVTRLAGSTQVTLDSAHFAGNGSLHDTKITEQVGRTLTSVQHLVSGASFQVAGKSAVASVRGTKFEVYIKPDGTMIVKLFDGVLDLTGKNSVHLVAPQQATADASGNVGPAGPIVPDPGDPFGPEVDVLNAVNADTTPGTEQEFVGAPLHNGEQQSYTYSYAGGALVKASLGYPGSSMTLKIQAPDGHVYTQSGPSPITLPIANAPGGIYTIIAVGVSGLGTAGEEPFLAVASVEPCVTSDVEQLHAIRRGFTAHDLESTISVSGLSNLHVSFGPDSPAGAIVSGSGTYDAVGWSGTVVLVTHGGLIAIFAVEAKVFGLKVPPQQILQQIGNLTGEDPSNIDVGFTIDRLFTCNGVLMIDGRAG